MIWLAAYSLKAEAAAVLICNDGPAPRCALCLCALQVLLYEHRPLEKQLQCP